VMMHGGCRREAAKSEDQSPAIRVDEALDRISLKKSPGFRGGHT
jgi:hypothetical protein